MNERQKRFADEYVIHANVYRAAINAGYSEGYAKGNASKLLENVSVKAYIKERLAEIESKKIAKADEILQFLTSTMRGEIKEPVAIFVGEGVQEVKYLPPNVQTRRQAGLDMLKRYDVLPKTQLEIQKLEKELQSEETTEDKLSQLIDSVDKQAGDE